MPAPALQAPHNDDDDDLAESLADAWAESASTNPIHRLHLLQALNAAPPPGEISQCLLAEHLGLSRRQIQRIERRALLRLQTALLAAAAGLPEAARQLTSTPAP